WFESYAVDDNGVERDDGIPAGSTFQSLSGSGVNYMIQPAIYNNVLQVSNNAGAQAQGVPATGTLTLVSPAFYSQIAVFSSSGNSNGTATGTLTINYADGTTQDATYNSQDWCANDDLRRGLSVIPPNPSINALTGKGAPVDGIGRADAGLSATGTS